MAAREVSLAMVLGMTALLSLAHHSAFPSNAAVPIFVGESAGKRAVFRPLNQMERRDVEVPRQQAPWPVSEPRRRAVGAWVSSPRSGDGGLIRSERAGARMAVPITRGQELGLRFRPDERAGSGDQPSLPRTQHPDAADPELHSAFRPIRPNRKPTYEELHAGPRVERLPAMPTMPYPMMPVPPLPVYPPLRW